MIKGLSHLIIQVINFYCFLDALSKAFINQI